MLERQYCCSRLEVRVVVRHSEVISGGESRGQQVRHSCGPVLALPSEFSLRAQSGLPMFSIHRSRCASGEPLAVMINYLPLDIAPDAGELETNGLYQSLRARGVHVRLAGQRIGARPATRAEARLLDEKPGAPLLTMSRSAFDDSGKAVEYGSHCYRASRYYFETTLVDR